MIELVFVCVCARAQGAAAFAATASEATHKLDAVSQAVMSKLESVSPPRTSFIAWDRADMDGYAPLV